MKNKQFAISEDLVLRILAIVLALTLWIYVQAQQPQSVHEGMQTFKDVEIQWNTNSNYIVTAITSRVADVTVRGQLDDINNLTKEDITITLELSEYQDGQHTVSLVPQLPGGIRLYSVSPSKIDVVLDEWQSVQLPVELEFTAALPDDVVVQEVIIEPSIVTVEGAAVVIEDIAKIIIPYDINLLGTATENIKPIAKNIYDDTLAAVSIKNYVNVQLDVKYRKWVPITLNIAGELPEGVTHSLQPARIAVLGEQNQIAQLEELITTQINANEIERDDVLDIEVVFPDGIVPTLQDYQTVTVSFK